MKNKSFVGPHRPSQSHSHIHPIWGGELVNYISICWVTGVAVGATFEWMRLQKTEAMKTVEWVMKRVVNWLVIR